MIGTWYVCTFTEDASHASYFSKQSTYYSKSKALDLIIEAYLAAIEDNSGTRTATNDAYSGRILRTVLSNARVSTLMTCGTLLLQEKSVEYRLPYK